MSDGGRQPRFVVLVKPGGAAPTQLLSALSRRQGEVSVVAEPPSVMVELAFNPAQVLIVVEPAHQPLLTELLSAVHRYHPQTRCWQYVKAGRDGRPELVKINGEYDSPPIGQVRAQSERLRSLVVKTPPPAAGPLISEEELAMLLGPGPENSADSA